MPTLDPARRGDERGASAVEFAIVLPVLLMILFAIMGFGFTMAQSASLASGAREGARLGAVNGVGTLAASHDCGDVVTRARAQAQTLGIANVSEIGVQVHRVKAGAATLVCTAGVGAAAATGSTGTAPCTDATATAATELSVRVTTTLSGRAFEIPLPGGQFLTPDTLTKSGEFRCEYH